jgi:hypothetical protein
VTPSQKRRLIGINASLRTRGVTVSLRGVEYRALAGDAPPDATQWDLSNETRAATFVSILRSEIEDTIVVGDSFACAENGCHYRVVGVEPRPSDILVSFKCESYRT